MKRNKKLPRSIVKVVQHACRMDAEGIDGIAGLRTYAAAREYDTESDDFEVALGNRQALLVSVAQHAMGMRGKALDGVLGPKTQAAARAYLEEYDIDASKPTRPARSSRWATPQSEPVLVDARKQAGFRKNGIDLRDGAIITPPGGLDPIPRRAQRNQVFGDARALGKKGIQARLVTIDGLPGRFNKGNGRLPQVHEKVAPHIKLVFSLWQDFGVLDEIYKIWFFNYRHMRHDTKRPLSLHSWGIACDINPRDNFAWYPKGEDKKIAPFSKAWYRKYPRGLSEVAVLCMKKAGFRWGGDWPSFRDPMHFELQTR